jgi:hypothetical protein
VPCSVPFGARASNRQPVPQPPPCRRTTGAYNAHNAKRGPATARYLEVCAPGQSWGSGSSFPSPRAGLPCPGPGRSVATWPRGAWTPWCCTEAFWHYYTLLGGACCMRKPRKQLFSGIALRGFALIACMGITTAPFLFFRRALRNCRLCTAPFASRKAMSTRAIHGKRSGPNRPPRTSALVWRRERHRPPSPVQRPCEAQQASPLARPRAPREALLAPAGPAAKPFDICH